MTKKSLYLGVKLEILKFFKAFFICQLFSGYNYIKKLAWITDKKNLYLHMINMKNHSSKF